jgi:hypothetical protein
MADSKGPDTQAPLDLSRGDNSPQQGRAIDQAPKGGHYIVDGRHVDANGNELSEDGSAKNSKDAK